MAGKCDWCNRSLGDSSYTQTVTENGTNYKSKERFCSSKCSYEYPYSCTPDKPWTLTWWQVVILLIILYQLGLFD